MRFADIILDLAALAKASRSVTSRHLELRARQIDRYARTSSIARSVTDQKTSQRSRDDGSVRNDGQGSDAPAPESTPNEVPIELHSAQDLEPRRAAATISNDAAISSKADLSRSLFQPGGQKVAQNLPRTYDSATLAALSQLRGNAKADQGVSHDAGSSQPSQPPHEDVPPGVDINIFHTARGSRMLEGEKDAPGQVRKSKVTASTPNWFKDFGHDKPFIEEPAGAKPLPQISKVGSSPIEQSAAAADVAIGTPQFEQEASKIVEPQQTKPPAASDETVQPVRALRESKVPATRISRIWNYGGLAAGMLGGALSESLSRGFGGGGSGSVMFSAGNMERLVAKLSRMRGAALKIGQMMSFQDSKMLPEPLREVLQRVQDGADYMPAWQRDRVLVASLGPEWRDLFEDFEETPIAAASIGQVHRATLKSGEKVAVKIQFPGVADSINSDLDNLSMLLTASKMLPKGLYLNKTIDNARTELGWECDYERELECGRRYKALLADETDVFAVPEIYPQASGKHVLTMQFMEGVGVTKNVESFTQDQRDWIGTNILRLCLREIAEFRFMQTDPNWTNFLFNASTNKLELLDFGASREYPDDFAAQYVSLLAAASRADRDAAVDFSRRLGYLTGHESRAMLDAHVASILTLAEPFLESAPEVYDFADQTITDRVRDLIPVMVRERLSPPPEETYSLHRKLSGAFLLCARLGSRVRCRELFQTALETTDLDVVRG